MTATNYICQCLLVLSAVVTVVNGATRDRYRSTCVESCKNSIEPVIFSDVDPEISPWERQCRSNLALISIYLCWDINCGELSRNIALGRQNETCQQIYGVEIPPFSASNYTADDIAKLPRVHEDDSFTADKPLSEAVIPAPENFQKWFATLDAWEYASKHHFLYGLAVVVFWILVILIGVSNRMYQAFCLSYYRSHRRLDLTKTSPIRGSWLKRNLLLPAAFGYTCARSVWWCTIPSRLQTVTIGTFLLINTVYCVIGYRFTRENYYFETYFEQGLRYVSDRTGIISFANFPIIWLFGMRNNVAMWLTGWDFGTYNNFHRWTARIATVQAIVHSIGYTILVLKDGWSTLWAEFLEQYWQAGVVSTVLMSLLTPLSIQWLRRRHYETFLLIHIGLSLLVLLAMLGHVSIFRGQYDMLFWIPVFIWIFDRALRFLRISTFRPLSWTSAASASYNDDADIITLTVPVEKSSLCKPKPGTFYYIMVPGDKNCWESHPFTVASVPANNSDIERPREQTALLHSPASSALELQETSKEELPKDSMTFLIRPYNSFTKRLRNLAMHSPTLNIMLDGPYGATHSLHLYSRVVFIVGGTGVIAPLSYLSKLLDKSRIYGSVEVHWSVREAVFAEMVVDEHFDMPLRADELLLTLYSSRAAVPLAQTTLPPQVRREVGRPDSIAIIESAAATAGGGSVAVVACGPEGMLDDARLGVVHALRRARGRIDYFQDSFSW